MCTYICKEWESGYNARTIFICNTNILLVNSKYNTIQILRGTNCYAYYQSLEFTKLTF